MTKKELSQLYYLKKEIKEQQRRLDELETAATACTAKITGLPSGRGISDKIGNYAAQIADLKGLLDLNLKKCFYELNRGKGNAFLAHMRHKCHLFGFHRVLKSPLLFGMLLLRSLYLGKLACV